MCEITSTSTYKKPKLPFSQLGWFCYIICNLVGSEDSLCGPLSLHHIKPTLRRRHNSLQLNGIFSSCKYFQGNAEGVYKGNQLGNSCSYTTYNKMDESCVEQILASCLPAFGSQWSDEFPEFYYNLDNLMSYKRTGTA